MYILAVGCIEPVFIAASWCLAQSMTGYRDIGCLAYYCSWLMGKAGAESWGNNEQKAPQQHGNANR